MQSLSGSYGDSFTDDITRYDLQFSSVLFSLLDRINQLDRDNYNKKVHRWVDSLSSCFMRIIPGWTSTDSTRQTDRQRDI